MKRKSTVTVQTDLDYDLDQLDSSTLCTLLKLWIVVHGGVVAFLLTKEEWENVIIQIAIQRWNLFSMADSDTNDTKIFVSNQSLEEYKDPDFWIAQGYPSTPLYDEDDPEEVKRAIMCSIVVHFLTDKQIYKLWSDVANVSLLKQLRNHTEELNETWNILLKLYPFPYLSPQHIQIKSVCNIQRGNQVQRLAYLYSDSYFQVWKSAYEKDIYDLGEEADFHNIAHLGLKQVWLEVMYRWFSDDVINFVSPVGKTFPKWVAGPYTLTEYYSPVYNKHIYIFGEIHDVDKDPCQNIPVQSEQVFPVHMFFDYLIREQYARGKVLDIFIETDKLIKGVEFERNDFLVDFITGDALSLLKHYFASYLTVDKIDDPLGYRDTPDGSLMGRLHYTDVRMNPNYRKELSNTRLTPLERCLHAINWIMLGKVYKKTSDEVLHFFNEGQCDVILKYKPENILKDLQTFIERYGILKQVTKVPFDEVRQFLYEKLYDTISIQNIIDQLKLFQNMLYMGASIDDLHTLLHEQIYGDFLIHLMDVYLIARVMKNPEFKNIIIYVGEYHAKTYREWLEELGFYLENSYIPQTESRCINIQMFEPFFEDKPY